MSFKEEVYSSGEGEGSRSGSDMADENGYELSPRQQRRHRQPKAAAAPRSSHKRKRRHRSRSSSEESEASASPSPPPPRRHKHRKSHRSSQSPIQPVARRSSSRRVEQQRSRSPTLERRSRSPIIRSRGRPTHREDPPPSRCLGVFGMSLYTTDRDLREYFGKFGPVEEVQLVLDHPTGRSRGFGFVYFENEEDAIEAKERSHDIELDGHKIRVDFSLTKRAHTPTPGVYMGRPDYGDDSLDANGFRPRRGGGGYRGGGGGYRGGGGYGGGGGGYRGYPRGGGGYRGGGGGGYRGGGWRGDYRGGGGGGYRGDYYPRGGGGGGDYYRGGGGGGGGYGGSYVDRRSPTYSPPPQRSSRRPDSRERDYDYY